MMEREVEPPRASTKRQLARWLFALSLRIGVVGVLGVATIAFVGSMDFGHDELSGTSEEHIAKLTVSKFAHEAYPQWSRDHRGCPRSLDDLTEYMDSARTTDPWGQRYRMFCTSGLLIVASSGADRIPNTADDLWSNR